MRSAHGPNYDRLASVKVAYDPENPFRMKGSVRPSG